MTKIEADKQTDAVLNVAAYRREGSNVEGFELVLIYDRTHITPRDGYTGLDWWGDEHPDYPREDWRHEVIDGNTIQGYWTWAASRQMEEAHD